MAETKETLNIKAKFDASQLKGEAKEAANDIKQNFKDMEKSVTSDFKSVENTAVDNLKGVERQASDTAKSVKQIGKEAQTAASQLQKLNLRQGIGVAAHGAQLVAGAIGNSKYGQTETGSALAGGLAGAASGAMMGVAFGPVGAALGAAAGGLLGAGKALMEAAEAQKKAALEADERRDAEAKEFIDESRSRRNDVNKEKFVNDFVAGKSIEEINAEIDKRLKQRDNDQQKLDEYADQYSANKYAHENAIRNPDASKQEIDKIENDYKNSQEDLLEQMRQRKGVIAEDTKTLILLTAKRDELIAAEQEEARKAEEAAREKERAVQEEAKAKERAAQEVARAAQEEARAKEKLAREEEAAKKKQWEEEKKEKLNSIKSEIDSAKDTLSEQEGLASELGGRANSFRITDSLTRIGGTSGYGSINESVQSSLAKLVDGVKSMAKNTASILEKLNADYSATQAAVWA